MLGRKHLAKVAEKDNVPLERHVIDHLPHRRAQRSGFVRNFACVALRSLVPCIRDGLRIHRHLTRLDIDLGRYG